MDILKLDDIYRLYAAQFVYKFFTFTLPEPLKPLFTLVTDTHSYMYRHSTVNKLCLWRSRLTTTTQSIINNGPKIWNSLPEHIYLNTHNANAFVRRQVFSKNVDDIEKSSDTLRGFIQVTRPHNAPFFLSSVLMKDDSEESIEETINDIYKHMKRKGCTVKSVRKIKQYGNVLSVKIVGIQSESDKVLDENFWPIGIRCRKWTN